MLALAAELRAHPANTVLTCSALKRAYRDRLRAAVPELRFVFMEIDPASARARIEARDAHFFSRSLVTCGRLIVTTAIRWLFLQTPLKQVQAILHVGDRYGCRRRTA